jgi:transcriptional regulator with XRE-family HTH domain
VQFSEKITYLLQKRGLSHRALAEHLGLSNASVSAWAKGSRPRAGVAVQLAAYFEVSVEDLRDDSRELPGIGPPKPQLTERPLRDVDRITLLISELERQIAALREERAAEKAARDAEFMAQPGVADALDAGLSPDEIRAMIHAEITRRRAGGDSPDTKRPKKIPLEVTHSKSRK